MKNAVEENFYKNLGYNLSTIRKKNGISQGVLALNLKMSRFSIVNIEAGRQKPSIYLLLRISYVLNCSVNELIPNLGDEVKMDSAIIKLIKKEINFGFDSKNKFHEFYHISKKIMNNEL